MKCSVKFYWNPGSHICVCILYGCFRPQNRVFPLWSFSEFPIHVQTALQRRAGHMKVFSARRWWAFWASWPSPVALYCMLDTAAEKTGSCLLSPPASMLSWVGNLSLCSPGPFITEPLCSACQQGDQLVPISMWKTLPSGKTEITTSFHTNNSGS